MLIYPVAAWESGGWCSRGLKISVVVAACILHADTCICREQDWSARAV